MNSPKCRISDVKVILSKCETIDNPVILKEALIECLAMLNNVDIPIKRAVEQLSFLFKHRTLNIEVNTDVTISNELYEYVKEKITTNEGDIKIIFNTDDCIFNSVSVIDSFNLTNIVRNITMKLILVVDDSKFNLKIIYHKLKSLLFHDYNCVTPDFNNNYTTFQHDDYFFIFCKNGKTGYDVFKTKTPYAIITDNDMPFMNGHDMSSLILESNMSSNILMISGNSESSIHDLITKYPSRIKFLCKSEVNTLFDIYFNQMFG